MGDVVASILIILLLTYILCYSKGWTLVPFPPVPRQFNINKFDNTIDNDGLKANIESIYTYLERLKDVLQLSDLIPLSTYSAVLSGVSNVDTVSTVSLFSVVPIGTSITVSGALTVTPLAAGLTVVGISLPFPTDIQGVEQCIGMAIASNTQELASIVGDIVNDRALLQFTSTGTTPTTFYFNFTYRTI